MKKFITGTTLAAALLASVADASNAQQPAPRQGPPPAAPQGQPEGPRRMGPGFGGPGGQGFAIGMFDPSHLLERRDVLNLTADQVTRLSGLENDLKAAREKAQTDSKPHRE